MKENASNHNGRHDEAADQTLRAESMPESVSALVRVLDQYLADLQAGKQPDRAQLLAEHPELAPQLEQALAGLEFIHQSTRGTEPAPAQLGDFRILREVGRGGMGVVYEAEQISLKRRVALKVLRFGAVADETAMQRFQREAETIAHLHHTNIVPIFAIGAEEGVRYYAMQFIEGRNLAELADAARKGEQAISARDIAHWGLQAAEALAHAHQRGVIHRDIKPSNLILDRDGRIWLTDFGLARRMVDVTLSVAGALLGTPRYMSPEQARASKDPVDHRTDIYSLGATLYELATRRPIFDAATPHEVITQILHAEPKAPRLVAPDVPRDLETIIMKCLAKDARHRYASAQALADDLRAFLEGRAISARAPSLPERVMRWTRKNRRSVTTASVSAGVSLVLMLGGWLGWRQHQKSREGQLMLHTTGRNLVAEVLDENDRAVTPSFPVPPLEPVSLPEGSYKVRLSASGLLSDTWPVDIHRGQLEEPTVQLPVRWLWPPRESSSGELPETFVRSLNDHTDVIHLTQAVLEKGGRRYEQRIERIDGATGFPVWTNALVLTRSNVPPGLTWEEWRRMLWPPNVNASQDRPRLLASTPDLDGDGTGDLVWISRHVPALGAVSGADGRVLWWYRSRAVAPENPADPIKATANFMTGTVAGEPAVGDVDGDGVMDFFACYGTEGESYKTRSGKTVRVPAKSWVSLVSGRTGAEVWRRDVDARWVRASSSWADQRQCNALCRPAIGRVGGRQVFVLVIGSQLHSWDAKTGEPAWPAQELGFEPLFAPDVADLDGDGDAEVLLTQPPDRNTVKYEEQTTLTLVAWSLKNGRELWRRVFRPVHSDSDYIIREAIDPFHRVVDLEGDGRPEVLLPVGRYYGWTTGVRWAGIELVDAATGQRRWLCRLASDMGHVPARPVDAFTVGPDLDGDGVREVFVSWSGFDDEAERSALNVAAVSGDAGAMLWKWSQHAPGPAGPLGWWHAGPDGWPMLIVPTESGPGGQRMTWFLSISDGRLQHTLPDVAAVTPADFDGDGILDLSYTVYPQGAARHLVVRGEPPAIWQRLGMWRAGEDYDGDGMVDFVDAYSDRLSVRSGRDGRELWHAREQRHYRDLFLTPAGRTGDLNRDGTPDFVGHVREWVQQGPTARGIESRLAAFSGRDGRRLWTATDLKWGQGNMSGSGPAWSYDYPLLDAAELDGDGRAEILSVQNISGRDEVQFSAVSGEDGRLLWEIPLVAGGWAPRPSIGRRPIADLNGDGVLDLAVWQPGATGAGRNEPHIVSARDSRDGRVLWTAHPRGIQNRNQILWPEPTVGDLDGDGSPEVIVVVRDERSAKGGYPCHLIALDGRTGETRWTWSWKGDFTGIWPPVVIADADGRNATCLGIRSGGTEARVVCLNSVGKVTTELPITGDQANFNSFAHGAYAWRAADIDGDGRAELLFLNNGRLIAARGTELTPVWEWQLPDPTTHITAIRPASAGRSAEIVVWSGKQAFGVSGGTGRAVWRAEVNTEPRRSMSNPPELLVMHNPASGGLPCVQLWWPQNSDYRWASVARMAWPVRESGEYEAPTPVKASFTPLPEVPAPRRPLPWTRNRNELAWFCSGLMALGLVGIPGLLIFLAVRRGPVLPGLVLTAYAAISPLVFGQSVVPLTGAGFAVWMLWTSLRNRLWWRSGLAGVCGALAVTPMLLRASEHYLRSIHYWGAWWWVDEWFLERILLTLVTLPGLAFWVHFGLAVWLRRWKQVRWLLTVSVCFAIGMAIIGLWADSYDRSPGERYGFAGWYWIWLVGAYCTGLGSLIVLGRLGWNQWRERRRERATAQAAPA